MSSLKKTFFERNLPLLYQNKVLSLSFIATLYFASYNIQFFYIGLVFIFIYMCNEGFRAPASGNLLFLIIILIVFSVISLSVGKNNLFSIALMIAISFVSYSIGAMWSNRSHDEASLIFFPMLMALSLAVPHLVITIQDIIVNGLINPERTLSIIGGEEGQRAVTQRAVELSLLIGSGAMYFIKSSDNKVKACRDFLVIGSIVALLCTMHYVSRTGLAIFFITMVIGFLLKGRLSFGTVIFIILVFIIYSGITRTEIFELYSAREIEGSSIGDGGGRTEAWARTFKYIQDHPFGSSSYHGFAHNFWLDFGKVGGVPSMLLLIIFSFRNIIIVLRIFIYKYTSKALSFYITILLISFLLALFTEAIHEGCPVFMFFYFMYCGYIEILYKRSKPITI